MGDGDPPLVQAVGLRKRFGNRTVVDGIDLRVRAGEFFGFLGANGAGKTSTMRMIGALSRRSGGRLRVLGLDPDAHGRRIRSRLGIVHQDDNLDPELTVADNLLVYGRYFGLAHRQLRPRIDELLRFARLAERRRDRVEALSGGMRRRLAIARALVNRPDLVILDEPTTGLDPQARHLLWERLYQLRARGVTMVLTTHYMDEAEQLCDRLVIMHEGRIVAEGCPRGLIDRHTTRDVIELRFARSADRRAALAPLADAARPAARETGRGRVQSIADRVFVYADGAAHLRAARLAGSLNATSFRVRRSSLEDVFLILTGTTIGG